MTSPDWASAVSGSWRAPLEVVAQIATGGRLDAERLPWAALRYQHTAAIRSKLAERYTSPATINRHLAALRGCLKEAWKLGLMTAEDYHRAAELPAIKGETLPAGREVTDGELRAIFAACEADQTPAGPKDACLLSILYGAGLRRAEATALNLGDYNPTTGELRILRGKGNKARIVWLTNGGQLALDAWLQARGTEPGPLLLPISRSGRIEHRRMTPQSVRRMVHRRSVQAGVEQFSPHDLRRSMISHLLDAGADISTVQQLAGHASVTTTQRYDRRGEEVKRKASSLIHVPYTGQRADDEIKTEERGKAAKAKRRQTAKAKRTSKRNRRQR